MCVCVSVNIMVCVCVCVTDLALLLGALQDPLLDAALADEAVDGHLLGLAQPVGSVHGLLVHRGVPVAVVEDHLAGERSAGQTGLVRQGWSGRAGQAGLVRQVTHHMCVCVVHV